MKKSKFLTRVMGTSMALLMALAGAGCSGGKSAAEQRGVEANSQNAKSNSDATSNIFKETQFDLSKLYDDDDMSVEISEIKKVDGKYCLLANKYDNHFTHEVRKIVVLKLDVETKEQEIVTIDINDAFNVYGNTVYPEGAESVVVEANETNTEHADTVTEGDDATVEDSENVAVADASMMDSEADPIYQMVKEQGSVTTVSYSAACLGDDGTVYSLRNTIEYTSDNLDPSGIKSVESTSLRKWDATGTFVEDIVIAENQSLKEASIYYNTVKAVESGVYIFGYSPEQGKYAGSKVDKDCKVNGPVVVDDDGFYGNCFLNPKGQISFLGYNNDYTKTQIKVLGDDLKIAQTIDLPSNYTLITSGIGFKDDENILYSAYGVLYSYHVGDEQAVPIADFVNSDLSMDIMNYVFMKDNGDFYGGYNDPLQQRFVFAEYNAVDPSEVVQKEVIRVAGFGGGIDNSFKQRIVDFNSKNETYRVVYEDYSKYSTQDDYMAGYTKLNNDILAGNAPDIFAVNEAMNIDAYISKGLIADVSELMDKDSEISQKEYLDNVFDAYKVDGKLYNVIPSFAVYTLMGKQSLVGDRSTWTLSDMKEVLGNMKEGTKAFGQMSKDTFLMYSILFNQADFINLTTGECSFDSQEFIDTLEFADSFSKDDEETLYDEEYWSDYESQFRSEKTLLYDMYIYDFGNVKRDINGYFGEPVSYIGFPTTHGNGGVIMSNESYAISSKSAHIDAAWSFLRELLLDDYQNNVKYSLPVLKSAFLEKTTDALNDKMKYFDEQGNVVEFEDSITINGEEVKIKGLSQEQLDQLLNYIYSINTSYKYDEQVFKIVEEESAAFFEGKKSAKEAADIIQNRVKLYLQENK